VTSRVSSVVALADSEALAIRNGGGSIPKRGWATWTIGERIAVLALLVALHSLILNLLK